MAADASESANSNSADVNAAAHRACMSSQFVCVVDGDEQVRRTLKLILKTLGVGVAVFSSAEDFLKSALCDHASCVIAETSLPGISGIELQRQLRDAGSKCPVILVSHDGRISTAVNAMQVGAFDFVQKPYRNHVILNMVKHALQTVSEARAVDGVAKVSSESGE